MIAIAGTIAAIIAVLAAILVPMSMADAPPAPTPVEETAVHQEAEQIDYKRALAIAEEHAGVKAEHIDERELDRDDGRLSWEIEFHSGGVEFEYDIDAYTGEIIEAERDDDDDRRAQAPQAQQQAQQIDGQRALAIAQEHAGVSADYVDDLELDHDDGRLSWEVEFITGSIEYEYDIDAYTGAVISYEQDHDD